MADQTYSNGRLAGPRLSAVLVTVIGVEIPLLLAGAATAAGVVAVVVAALPWGLVLAVAATAPPPPPLAQTSILMNRVVWVIRVGWATVVLGAGGFVGALVSRGIHAGGAGYQTLSAVLQDYLGSIVVAVVEFAALSASAAISIQLSRLGAVERNRAIDRFIAAGAARNVPVWLVGRLIRDVTKPVNGFVICCLCPLVVTAGLFGLINR